MAIEVAMNTPLAEALNTVIQPKLIETGWATGGGDDSALSEYIILMLVNGKSQEQLANELSGDLLGLGPDDPGAREFARWLFDQIETLNAQLNGGSSAPAAPAQGGAMAMDQDADMSNPAELNAPTGPKSMRNGNNNMRGGREKRMFGHMNKAMDRNHDHVLHRVRNTSGNERINAHGRQPPSGPRGGGPMRGNHRMNNRAAGLAAGLSNMAGMPGMPGAPGPGMNGMPADPNWMMQGGGGQEQIFNLLQQQNQMMAVLQQQLNQQNQQGGNNRGGRFDRGQRGGNNFRGRGSHQGNGHRPHHNNHHNGQAKEGAEGEDVEMGQTPREPPNPDTTVCRFNLSCTNKECKFAHQSPAAPHGITVDTSDVCTYGAACKNFKCTGRHPSPATKRAHQNEQECKFFPNCTNPKCPFRHPDMPPCRNGGDCSVEGCKFTHLQTMCKYKPCTNRYCPFKHEEGQRGAFPDKVWTADGSKSHVSERKFVEAGSNEEIVLPGAGEGNAEAQEGGAMDEGIA